MSSFDEKMSTIAEQVLKRPLTEDEQLEMYKVADAMGMRDVQSFLHQLLVFKLQEDTMRRQFEDFGSFKAALNERFQELALLETRIYETLEAAVSRVLSEGATRIGADMGSEIASQAKGIFSSVGAYHSLKGQILLSCMICGTGALGYFLGESGALRAVSGSGVLATMLFMPVGWCFFLCGAAYIFYWVADNWAAIKKKKRFKAYLGGQIVALLLLLLALI